MYTFTAYGIRYSSGDEIGCSCCKIKLYLPNFYFINENGIVKIYCYKCYIDNINNKK